VKNRVVEVACGVPSNFWYGNSSFPASQANRGWDTRYFDAKEAFRHIQKPRGPMKAKASAPDVSYSLELLHAVSDDNPHPVQAALTLGMDPNISNAIGHGVSVLVAFCLSALPILRILASPRHATTLSFLRDFRLAASAFLFQFVFSESFGSYHNACSFSLLHRSCCTAQLGMVR